MIYFLVVATFTAVAASSTDARLHALEQKILGVTEQTDCSSAYTYQGSTWSVNLRMSCGTDYPNCFVTQKSSPTANGCGSGGVNLPWENAFTPACNFHDLCYGRCTDKAVNGGEDLTQKNCDDIFLNLMKSIIDERGETEDASTEDAMSYYSVVQSNVGALAFGSAMGNRCKCSATEPTEVSDAWHSWLDTDMADNAAAHQYDAAPRTTQTIARLLNEPSFFNDYLAQSTEAAP